MWNEFEVKLLFIQFPCVYVEETRSDTIYLYCDWEKASNCDYNLIVIVK